MKKVLQLIVLVIVVTFTSCGDTQKKEQNQKPVTVSIQKTTINSDNSYIAASGTIETEQHADISTRMMGYVSKIHVKVGDQVTKGQLLVNINNTDIVAKEAQVKAGIIQAKAGFQNAEKDYNRFKTLFNQQSASQKELDDMTTRYEVAKAQLEAAKQMQNEVNAHLNYSNLTAPFSGTITGKYVNEGDMANPGMPLISIEGQGTFLATAMIPETNIASISKGQKVMVFIKSSNEQISGTVSEVSNSARLTGGQYIAKIKLDKSAVKLYSGMFVTTHFPTKNNANNTILVPESSIVKKGELRGIYTVSESNTALLRWVRLGASIGDNVEILTGLSQNETYILSSESKLYNGATIIIKQ